MLHKRPVSRTLVYTLIIFVKSSNFALIDVFVLSKPSDSGRHFVWRAFATFLSINLISTFCTQFQLFALNFNFLHRLGLIDVLSANELAETFACVLLVRKKYRKRAKESITTFCSLHEFCYGVQIRE